MRVFDVVGREIAMRPEQSRDLVWDATRAPNGLYIVKIQTTGGTISRSVALSR